MPVVACLGLFLWVLALGASCQAQREEELRRNTNYERQFTDEVR